jgi:hypothetical protein
MDDPVEVCLVSGFVEKVTFLKKSLTFDPLCF